jgi:phosphoribosylglycinamide formyltransferase 1
MKNIAIFASGSGSNAENIIRYFKGHSSIRVSLVVSNKPEAGVVQKAKDLSVPVSFVQERPFFESSDFVKNLGELNIDLIVLAGFLWKIPDLVLKAYHNRIINIHPSLLPKFGGKGMYGRRVHQAVLDAKEKEAGVTIHYVNEHYDEGEIIFQEKIAIHENETCESLALRIHELEHTHYPRVIEEILNKQKD